MAEIAADNLLRPPSGRDSMSTDKPNFEKRKRNWSRSSLCAVFVFIAISATFAIWIGKFLVHAHLEQQVVEEIETLGGRVIYDYQDIDRLTAEKKPPPGPKFVRRVIGDNAFTHVQHVTFLWNAEITDEDLAVLTRLPHLKSVTVLHPGVTEKLLDHLAQVQQLSRLDLGRMTLTSDGMSRLKSKNLTKLCLADVEFADGALWLGQFPNLEALLINSTDMSSADLAGIAHLKKLRVLWLHGNRQVDDDGLLHLAQITNLEELDLHETSITDAGLHHLSGLRRLRYLNLSQTSITGVGFKYIVGLPNMESMYLYGTNIDDAAIATLAKVQSLKTLYLGNTKITGAAINDLAKLHQLRVLKLYPENLTDGAVLGLRPLSNLRELSIGPSPPITKDAARELKASLPRCHIMLWSEQGSISSAGGKAIRGLDLP